MRRRSWRTPLFGVVAVVVLVALVVAAYRMDHRSAPKGETVAAPTSISLDAGPSSLAPPSQVSSGTPPVVAASQGRPRPVVALFGDSYSEGTGATNPSTEGYVPRLARLTGWDIQVTSLSGGGYRNPGRDRSGPYWQKISASNYDRPDLVFLQGGLNDSGFGQQTRDGVQRAVAAAQTRYPNTPIVILGMLFGARPFTQAATVTYDALQDTARQQQGIYYIPTADLSFPLVSDRTHPTSDGHAAIAQWIADRMRR